MKLSFTLSYLNFLISLNIETLPKFHEVVSKLQLIPVKFTKEAYLNSLDNALLILEQFCLLKKQVGLAMEHISDENGMFIQVTAE